MKEEENVYEETTRSEDATAVEGEKASTVPGKFKDVDALVGELARILGYGINACLQEGLSVEDVTGLLG